MPGNLKGRHFKPKQCDGHMAGFLSDYLFGLNIEYLPPEGATAHLDH